MMNFCNSVRTGILTCAALLLLSTFSSGSARAADLKEVFVQYDTNVQIFLTNQPCEDNTKTGYAYALNTDTGDKALGCFVGYNEIIEIELDRGDHLYHYFINAHRFEVKE